MNYPELDVDALLPRLVGQLGTLIAVDAMEFPLEAIPCEGKTHGKNLDLHDDGPATMYLQVWHKCWAVPGEIQTACARNADRIAEWAGLPMWCDECPETGSVRDFVTVLGPIGSMGKEAS